MRHADSALKQLEKLIARDPLLRDIVNPSLPAPRRAARFEPAVDVLETASGWLVLVDVPGGVTVLPALTSASRATD